MIMSKLIRSLSPLGNALFEMVFLLPIITITALNLLPATSIVGWIVTLPLVFLAPAVIYRNKVQTRMISRIMTAVVLGVAHSSIIVFLSVSKFLTIPILLSSLVVCYIADRGYLQHKRGYDKLAESPFMFGCIVVYIIVQPLNFIIVDELLVIYPNLLNVGAIIAIIFYIILTNERHFAKELVETRNNRATIISRRRNRTLIGLLTILIICISMFLQAQAWLGEKLKEILRALLNRSNRDEPETPPEAELLAPDFILPSTESKVPSIFWTIFNNIILFLGTIIIALIVVAILYKSIKVVFRIIQLIRAKLLEKQYGNNRDDSDYKDEVESLLHTSKWRKKLSGTYFSNRKIKEVGWNDLTTNGVRVRYLYKEWLKKKVHNGYSFNAYSTPREIAAELAVTNPNDRSHSNELEDFITTYEEARYGNEDPTDDKINKYKSWLERMRKKSP